MTSSVKSAIPLHVIRFAEGAFKSSLKGSFSNSLRMNNVALISANRTQGSGVKFSYKVPTNLCLNQFSQSSISLKEAAMMSTSATLAVFDELSSYAFMVKDKTCRIGVSVLLSTEILRECPADSDVIVEVEAIKIGKTLGFAIMEMRDSEGLLLARGRHIKYLPMGPLWDLFAHPAVSHLTFPFLERIANTPWVRNSSVYKKLMEAMSGGRNSSSATHYTPPDPGVGQVFQSLGVTPLCDSSFTMHVTPSVCNMIGRLHGGALAMAVEQAVNMKYGTNDSDGRRIVKLEIEYLSAMKVGYVSIIV